jgi:serine phosphatase RsbU (regulator of sigma subunit)
VSGDFYDVFTLPGNNKLILAVADVCDKGVGAALFMAVVRTLIRAFSTSQFRDGSSALDLGVQSIVELVHQYVLTNHSETGMFATLFVGGLDTATGELAYVNAGHEAPYVLRQRELKMRLDATGPGIGLFEQSVFAASSCRLAPGDAFFAYTDGITEARNTEGEFYGVERLCQVICPSSDDVRDLVFRVEQSVSQHLAGQAQFDDITALAIRKKT